jgi:hypothetical protein
VTSIRFALRHWNSTAGTPPLTSWLAAGVGLAFWGSSGSRPHRAQTTGREGARRVPEGIRPLGRSEPAPHDRDNRTESAWRAGRMRLGVSSPADRPAVGHNRRRTSPVKVENPLKGVTLHDWASNAPSMPRFHPRFWGFRVHRSTS